MAKNRNGGAICIKEPKRRLKRYFIDDMKFFYYFGKQLLGCYKDPFKI